MVQVEDLKKMGEAEEPYMPEKPTLLSKYQIPVQHLDFDYIEECKNDKELEKILHILKSGQEGYFPDLLKAAEKKLGEIKPNSKWLRKVCPVLGKTQINKDEWDDLSNDLAGWVEDVNKKDHELEERKIKSDVHLIDSDIRKTTDGCTYPQVKPNPKRIAATDYESWDKYDPDTEIFKMDLEDEKLKKEALKEHKAISKKSKTVRFTNFATEAEALYEANRERERGNECFKAGEYQTALQHYTNSLECKPLAAVYTNRALIYNKVKKYKNAVDDCKAALKLEPNNFKAHLRMAQNYDALQQYDEALESVENAIEIDPNNTTAQQLANHLHKASGKTNSNTRFMIEDVQSTNELNLKPILKNITNKTGTETQNKHEKIGIKEDIKFLNAPKNQDVDSVNNSYTKPLKSILKINKNSEIVGKNNKGYEESQHSSINSTKSNLQLHDAKSSKLILKNGTEKSRNRENAKKHKHYEVIAIPGTSTMPPPYYKIVYSSDPEIIRREKQKILFRPMLLHMTTIDVTSDDENQKEYNYNETIESICPKNYKEKKKTKRSTSIKIRDDLETFQLENFKFNDEETTKEIHKHTWNNIRGQKTSQTPTEVVVASNNKGAGGEPYYEEQQFTVPTAEELQSPYTFIEIWNSIRTDNSYTQHAEILKRMDFNRIHYVIGYKLDDTMLSIIINCLYRHFMVPGELDRLYAALESIIRIPRFTMMSMFLEESDWRCIFQLIEFLDQHGRSLPNNIKDIYYNK